MRRIDSKPKKKTVNKITKSLNYNQSKGEFKKEPKEIKIKRRSPTKRIQKSQKKKERKKKTEKKKEKKRNKKKGGEKKKEEGKEEEAKEEAFVTFPKV